MFSEHHRLAEAEKTIRRQADLYGRYVVFSLAWPSGKRATGTSGGEMVVARTFWNFSAVEEALVAEVIHRSDKLKRRWASGILRLRGQSVLVAELYMHAGIELSGENCELLRQVENLIKAVGLLVVAAADWQTTPQSIEESGWTLRNGLKLVALPMWSSLVRWGQER